RVGPLWLTRQSLHDAIPILGGERVPGEPAAPDERAGARLPVGARDRDRVGAVGAGGAVALAEELCTLDAPQLAAQAVREDGELRSEEHTSELQSREKDRMTT